MAQDKNDNKAQTPDTSVEDSSHSEPTVVNNPMVAKVVSEMKAPLANVPWTLQEFIHGDINLDVELAKRFPNMPLLSSISFRQVGKYNRRGVATLKAQDGQAMMLVDVSRENHSIQFSFTYGSMLTLRFMLDTLSEMDRARWMELMRRDRDRGKLAFLWSSARWKKDYLICINRRYFTSLLAFSPNNIESGVRMTPEVTTKLLDWLEEFWQPQPFEPPELAARDSQELRKAAEKAGVPLDMQQTQRIPSPEEVKAANGDQDKPDATDTAETTIAPPDEDTTKFSW